MAEVEGGSGVTREGGRERERERGREGGKEGGSQRSVSRVPEGAASKPRDARAQRNRAVLRAVPRSVHTPPHTAPPPTRPHAARQNWLSLTATAPTPLARPGAAQAAPARAAGAKQSPSRTSPRHQMHAPPRAAPRAGLSQTRGARGVYSGAADEQTGASRAHARARGALPGRSAFAIWRSEFRQPFRHPKSARFLAITLLWFPPTD